MVSAFGVCAAFGAPMNMLTFVLPFVLLGIGVDDTLVIIFSYREQLAKTLQPKEKVNIIFLFVKERSRSCLISKLL